MVSQTTGLFKYIVRRKDDKVRFAEIGNKYHASIIIWTKILTWGNLGQLFQEEIDNAGSRHSSLTSNNQPPQDS